MGKDTFSRESYTRSVKRHVSSSGPATARAERQARSTGKLNPLVDPQGFGVIRRSLPRYEKQDNGLWLLTVGTPMPIETRVDTTGSMGNNVDIALRVLPKVHELCSEVLSGYDLQIATGIFGDVSDRFVLCRPQFEMIAEKIVEQLTLMVPERAGGDADEDPHYGLFGAAYLTAAYLHRIGLKSYDFTISDARARDLLDERQIRRIFGDEVFDKVIENGHQIDRHNLPTTKEVVQDLLERSHAFFLQVGDDSRVTKFWKNIFGPDRVVILPSTELLPQVQAVIIGLTEGTMNLDQVPKFLKKNNVSKHDAEMIICSVANIPIGAQIALPNFNKRPRAGDLFREKTDLWPVNPDEINSEVDASNNDSDKEGPEWL
ncbi:hypothetical protein A2531_02775 [Candidatus Falkowbacteria bacterium RIFOXYD2_FULL_34_120]|uniref:Uncharacterized protein n=1 Tax=Candidatus Falkowbacteria bacterium RIFOXYD2_FULL_34_120 TaxID=1798007 RepID=A0A1F5TS15_9BACT|nr:MAG: hypothetical protein A2466_03060 [Candidatus Falkowbacteria bacterium RIFOXYC2_FULL_34_220]OGF39431.1 MAG: hypothetical protein A2515_03830 [Candidatus Falkowbacteria bacterium RIFOXYD12_FULL_34_57]OGF41587.1 MAG: hypothetical protein A2531_02775 [Candidatus Falkowbacteria bacterium RIFOXYD2_FULL_34_120]